MFKVKASFIDSVTINCETNKALLYFSDLRNFVELMSGIESIHTDLKGVTHWTIRAEIPVVGLLKERFSVVKETEAENLIEWVPAKTESRNFLRFSARFENISEETTVVEFSQAVELRREKAKDLHPLAAMVGESLISREMNRRVAEMISEFTSKAKIRLEGPNT